MRKLEIVSAVCPQCLTVFKMEGWDFRRGRKFCSTKCHNESMKVPIEKSFWDRVDMISCLPCWIWTGATNSWGYGELGSPPRGAHRVSWELNIGPIPKGISVLHTCDTPLCVNYEDHLFLGTQRDNMIDMTKKGHGVLTRGEKHGTAKLTEESVLAIRQLYTVRGITCKSLASQFSVTKDAIWRVVAHKNWAWL